MRKLKEKNQLPPQEIVYPVYSDKELDDFAKFLEKFREEKEVRVFKKMKEQIFDSEGKPKLDAEGHEMFDMVRVSEMKTLSIINLDEAAVEFGAMKKSMHNGRPSYAVIIAGDAPKDSWGNYLQLKFTLKYNLFQHKYHTLKDRLAKKRLRR